MGRHYQQHDHNCAGPDWVVVQRIINAGTIDIFQPDHVICDCERAAVVAYTPNAGQILHCNGPTYRRLKELWQTLEGNIDAVIRRNLGGIEQPR